MGEIPVCHKSAKKKVGIHLDSLAYVAAKRHYGKSGICDTLGSNAM